LKDCRDWRPIVSDVLIIKKVSEFTFDADLIDNFHFHYPTIVAWRTTVGAKDNPSDSSEIAALIVTFCVALRATLRAALAFDLA